jgi:hypothetical protein
MLNNKVKSKIVSVLKQHTVKMYGGEEVKLHTLLTMTLDGAVASFILWLLYPWELVTSTLR